MLDSRVDSREGKDRGEHRREEEHLHTREVQSRDEAPQRGHRVVADDVRMSDLEPLLQHVEEVKEQIDKHENQMG